MTKDIAENFAMEGDYAQLVGLSHKNFIIQLTSGAKLQTHRGELLHNDLIGLSWGSEVLSHKGRPFFLLQPSFADLLIDTPRATQILYPKDIGFILLSLDIRPGKKIIEAGTGSGALTCALANAVGDEGIVFSYEVRKDTQNLAKKNLARLDLLHRVNLINSDIADGFNEENVDAIFLDVPDPHNYVHHTHKALKPGGYLGCILPTVNQIRLLLIELRRNQFAYIDVCEILIRYYKSEPERLRPVDRMVAHTGYLIFARAVTRINQPQQNAGLKENSQSGEVEKCPEDSEENHIADR